MVKIDADAHVLETEKTWEYMEGTDRKYRPQIVGCTDGSSNDEYWLVDGTLRLKSRNVGKNTPMASRELRDVSVRLKHMDELGVDIQVIFPTIFIIPLTQRSGDRAGALPQLQPVDGRYLATGARSACAGSPYCRFSAWIKFLRKQSLPRKTARSVFFSAAPSARSF
jgi:hypothetical protein